MSHTNYIEALLWRYATKDFTSEKIPTESFDRILQAARLAPSSYGLEPWKIIHVTDTEVRSRIQEAGYNQEKITEASELVVIVAETDGLALVAELVQRIVDTRGVDQEGLAGYKNMMIGSVEMHEAAGNQTEWHKSQTYLMLGFMLVAAALEGVDACPMEGFDVNAVNKILGIADSNMTAVTMVALGYRSEQDEFASLQKVRKSMEEFVQIK